MNLRRCLFCGSHDVDAEGWKTQSGTTGPQCAGCGATAESVDQWNDRTWLIDAVAVAVDQAIRKSTIGTFSDLSAVIEKQLQ